VKRRSLALAVLLPAAIALSSAPLAGCPDGGGTTEDDAGADVGPSPCATGFLGDPNAAPEIELRALTATGEDVPLTEGGELAIIFPPQGGRVAFLGVRARNVDGCGLKIIGALRDPVSKGVTLDGRTVNLAREADGWGTTGRGANITNIDDSQAIGDYSNVPLCPNSWAKQDVFDEPFEVEVQITDRLKRAATKKVTVTPRCAEPGARETSCRCLCKAGYVLGESCGEDAGAPEGGTP